MLTRVPNLTTYISFIIVLVLRSSSNSTFLSFNLTTSTEDDGTTINKEDRNEF